MENKEGLCEAEVKKNLVLAEIGEPLTLPLATLNRSCEFKKEWDRIQNKWHGITKEKREWGKKYNKDYFQRPGVKEKALERSRRPEVRAKIKKYRDDHKEEKKEYNKKYYGNPESEEKIKAKKKIYDREYTKRSEVKARRKKAYEENKK